MGGYMTESTTASPHRPHVVFVDDEKMILSGLRRLLHGQRKNWDISFANSGAEALSILETKPCDVVVSDYRMPGMDGAALLRSIRERYPGTARVILSGQTERQELLNVVLLAHRFLHKPCRKR